MPRMIPSEYVESTESKAEIFLFNAMKKQLPQDFFVFHSLALLDKTAKGKSIDAEIDFVVLTPKLGLIVIEVKGGQIAFKDGSWTQNGWKLKKSPAKQALENKYALIKYLNRQSPSGFFHANFAHAVCFPDCFDLIEVPPDCEGICITGKDIPYLAHAIEKILLDFSKKEENNNFDHEFAVKKLSPVFEYGISLPDKVKISESKILQLTEQQCEMLNFISEHKKALIRGCAGSGKTILALKKASELASNGAKVLLLAYNSLLCQKLQYASAGNTNITAITFHELCIKHLKENGIELSPKQSDDKVWTEVIPAEFLKILPKSPLKFDAVIVDEGQDFNKKYWESVSQLVKPEGHFFIFYDPDQNLFNDELSLPELGTPFILDKNCRNTVEIFTAIKPYCSVATRISEYAPNGIPVCEFREKSTTKRREILSEIITDISSKGIFERQIVILGGHSMANTSIGSNPFFGNFEIIENATHDIGKVPYFTYMKFKGCESDIVILLDVDENDPRWNKEGLYTAMSRAKHMLYLIRKN